jgi:hypothetical protein
MHPPRSKAPGRPSIRHRVGASNCALVLDLPLPINSTLAIQGDHGALNLYFQNQLTGRG